MRESAIEKKVCDHARQEGMVVMKLSGINQKGQPDRMFLKNRHALFLEFKAPGKLPTALQYWWLSQLKSEGFTAGHCDSVESGIATINEFLKNVR